MKNRFIVRILLLSLAAAGGFWVSRRLTRPRSTAVDPARVEAPDRAVRLVPAPTEGGTA